MDFLFLCCLLIGISCEYATVVGAAKHQHLQKKAATSCADIPVCSHLPDICTIPDQTLAKSLCPAKCGYCPGLNPTPATSSLYDSSCVVTADCTFDNSQCVSGFCKCVKELKYDQSSGTCVTQCAHYGDQFTVYDNMVITYHNDASTNANGIDECVTFCLAQSFITLSIDWNDHAFNGCSCSTHAPGMAGVVVVNNTNYDLAVRQCGLASSTTTHQTTPVPVSGHISGPCDGSPCINGGACYAIFTTFGCVCPSGFSGPLCNIANSTTTLQTTPLPVSTPNSSPCDVSPCINGGGCYENSYNNSFTFRCVCPSGFSGPLCNIDDSTTTHQTTPIPVSAPNSGPCDVSPCINGGACVVKGFMFTCACPSGFSGPLCNIEPQQTAAPTTSPSTTTDAGFCALSPCQNGGICNEVTGGFVCLCPPGFDHPVCSTQTAASTSPLTTTPTATTTTTRVTTTPDHCASNPCQNGGICSVANGAFICLCPPGFSHPVCAVATSSLYNSSCVETADCTFDNSQCVSGFCKCVKELKYDQSSGTCVSQCAKYGDQFTVYDNVGIYEHHNATLHAGSLDGCSALCLAESFTTLSIDWNEFRGECHCSTVAPGMPSVTVGPKRGFRLGVRQCGLATSSLYDSSCVETADCTFDNSQCVSGFCKCVKELKYDQSSGTCVSQCAEYGDQFTLYDNVAINGYNTDVATLHANDFDKCIAYCLAESFTTLSIDWVAYSGVCYCSTAAPGMKGVVVVPDMAYGLAVRQCALATSSLYDGLCVETRDCAFANSQCVSGFCKCVMEMKYDQSSSTCVSQCAHYGDQFTLYDDFGIIGHNDDFATLQVHDIDKCIGYCLSEPFTTLSIDWIQHSGLCVCSTAAPGMAGVVVAPNTEVDGYGLAVRQCGLGNTSN